MRPRPRRLFFCRRGHLERHGASVMGRIKISYYHIPIAKAKGKPERPIRIAVFGDLHGRLFGEGNARLADAILRHYPDLIFCVGDLIVANAKNTTKYEVGLSLLRRLACDCPVYCVNGNHEQRAKASPGIYKGDYAKLASELRRAGITLLENARVRLDMQGARLTIHGLDLPHKYYRRFGKEFPSPEEIRQSIGAPDEGRCNLLLTHNPIFFESYALWGADVTFAGHLHGGVVRLPFVGGLVSPQAKLFPRYDRGLYERYGRRMIVTAGLGTHSMLVRVNNPPEVVVLGLS